VQLALTGGDDYELCFTVPAAQAPALQARLQDVKCAVTRIGVMEEFSGCRVSLGGSPVDFDQGGYDHFGGSGQRRE